MSHKNKCRTIPYETIVKAVGGDSDALFEVVLRFRGFTRSKCIRGFKDEFGNEYPCVNEEMLERVEAKLIQASSKVLNPNEVVLGCETYSHPNKFYLSTRIYQQNF